MRVRRARVVALVAGAWCLLVGVGSSVGAAPSAVTIDPAALPTGAVGSPYRQPVSASGPSPPYTVRITQGALPSGLSFSSRGALVGSPARAGSFAFTISAFTTNGTYVAFRDYVLRVAKAVRTSGRAYFADDFENGLGKWNRWGDASAFRLVHGRHGRAVSITVGPTTTGSSSTASELASLWLDWPKAYGESGYETWYAANVKFPKDYRATPGQWNWFLEWHNDDATSMYPGAYSPALGVYTDYPVRQSPGRRPRLAFRVMGGSVSSPTQHVFALPPNSLKLGWWYDLVVRFVWSADPGIGLAQLWVDGRLAYSTRAPTLYRHPGGATSFNYFGLYNYRPKSSWDASIHFDRIRLGPTRAAVVGKQPARPSSP